MKVELLAYTQRPGEAGNPLAVVEQAACVCYDSAPDLKNFKVAKGCARSGHLSVWEHIAFTFKVQGVSRSLLAQLTRHRHGSYSVRSQRYCPEDGFQAINPFHDSALLHGKADWYFYLTQNGYVELRELGASPEDARSVLPNACGTELVLTFNARALIEASHLRLCSRAQREIRELFANMRKAIEPVCPELARLMVPKCESFEVPFCPERQSCGRHKKLKELTTYAPAIPRDQWEDQANNT